MAWIDYKSKESNGMNRGGFLYSQIFFEAFVKIREISENRKIKDGRERLYWTVVDSHGAKFSIFDAKLARDLPLEVEITLKGDVRIFKGATFLNASSASYPDGTAIEPQKTLDGIDSPDFEVLATIQDSIAQREREKECENEGLPF